MKSRSPAQLARDEGLRSSKPLDWIASGELVAVNLATSPTGRARWRITDDAWADFLARRAAPPPKPDRRRRRKKLHDVIEFFQ